MREIDNHYMWFNEWLRDPNREYSFENSTKLIDAIPYLLALIPPTVGYSITTNPDNYYPPTWADIVELEKLGLQFLKCSIYEKMEKTEVFERIGT